MAIKGLRRGFAEYGKIKIGKKGKMITSTKGKEFRPPEKLDHFILTTTEKDENGDLIVDTELMDRLKASNRAIRNSKSDLVGIPIRLLYNDTDLNFTTRYASYVSGKLSCSGDGKVAYSRVNPDKPRKCPCERLNADYEGRDKCKVNGSLTCIIDEAEFFGGAHKFRTTSFNSVSSILGSLDAIKVATNGRLAFIPLMLTLKPKTTSAPGGSQVTVYTVSICFHGDVTQLRQAALEMA